MAENIPQLPFSNERPAAAPQPNQKFSAEDIRSRMAAINNYVDTNGPQILAGIKQSRADQANYVSQFKDYMSKGTPDIYKVQNLVSGNVMTGPNPGLNQVNIPTAEYVNTLMNKSKFEQANNSDPYFFARPTSFNASKFGLNYDRYYSHSKFKELGFSIYRDNESTYNANSTWLDDFRRMGSKWFSLAYQGGSGLFKNWGTFGAYGEAEDAAQMENDLSIAMSSKGGAGAWATNFLANSGYSVGVMGEIVLEELVLAGATGLTGGVASPLAALRTGQNLAKLGKSMKIMTETLGKADKSRLFWKAAQSAGSKLLPTETLSIGAQALNPNSAFNRLNDFAKTTKTFGAFYRDMREINAVTSEARLEGGFAQNKVANEALDAFIKENNRMPNSDEAKIISDKAVKAGKETMLYNTPAIYLSNKIVLDTALKGFKPIRRIMSQEGLTSSMFKLVKNQGWKEAGKKAMEVVPRGMLSSAKNMISKDYLRSIPSKLTGTFSKKSVGKTLGGGLRYFNANLMEGLQESYQEAIQAGVTDYYLNNYLADLYKDPHLAANNSLGASIVKGIEEQFSGQGFDTFAQGFLMGGVMGGAQNIIMPGLQRAGMKTKDWYSKTNSYEEYQKTEQERLQKYADAYNDISENPYKYVNWLDENVALQRDLAERYQTAEETGNRKEAEDSKDASMFSHITTLLQTGRYDAFIDQLEDLNDLSDNELADAFNSPESASEQNKKSPRERLQTAIKKSKDIKGRWEKVNEKFENPYKPDYFDKVKDKEAYEAESIGYKAFEMSKRAIAFNEYTFDRTISRLSSLVNNAATSGPLGNVEATAFSALYSNDQSFKIYRDTMSNEIEALNLGDAQQKNLAKKKSTQLSNLVALKDAMQDYKNKLLLIEKAKGAMSNPEAASEESKAALKKLRTDAIALAKGITDETGQQYVLNFEEGLREEIQPDVVVDEFLKDELYAAYAKYTKNIADLNNVFPINESIENSFGDLVDFVKLDHDAKQMAEYADVIANPMSIYAMTNRIANALKTVGAKKKELHLEGLTTYKRDILDVDDLLQKLLDMGVYFDPDYINDFRKNGVLPEHFIDAMTGQLIEKTNSKYNQIVSVIEEEEKLRGVTFSNKPVEYKKPEEKKPETKASAETKIQEEELEETTIYDVTTEFSKFPSDIKTKLKEAHSAAMLDGATSDIQEWMLEDPDAALIISGKKPAVKKTKTSETEVEETEVTDLITKDNPKSFIGAPAEFKEQFDNLAEQEWRISPDQKSYVSKDAEVSNRVSDLKEGSIPKNAATKASTDRGIFVDDVLRDFATPGADGISFKDNVINLKKNGETDSQVKFKISIFLKSLSGVYGKKNNIRFDEGYIDTMSSVLLNLALRWQAFNWYTSVPTMIGTLLGEKYGGTIDLMLEKDGNYYIIDLKTSTEPRRIKGVWYDRNDQIQQNAYAELSEQLTGKPISGIFILNLVTTMTDNDNRKMASVELDEYDDAEGKKTILVTLPRIPVAELKGYTPKTSEETPPTPSPVSDVVSVYHHTTVKPKDFNFSSFQRGKDQISQFGDGLNASSTTTPFLVKRYGNPIQGEVRDSDFVKIDASKTEKEVYQELKKQGYAFSEEHNTNDILADIPGAAMELFTDFQKSNPKVKGVKVINHIIGNQKVDPFYVIYDAKSFYGLGSLSKTQTPGATAEINEQKIEKLRAQEQADLAKAGIDLTKFKDTYGEKQGNMPDDLYAIYKPIYDEYNAKITALSKAPASDKKADIEKTLYGTISGSIPLSQALPNGVYTDLGNGLFAYADKNEKIAAIVDRTNGYIVSKSFWNEKQNKWQLPNQANLKDDAKKLGVDEATYIKKYQDAVDSLNKAELAALEAKPAEQQVDWNAVIDRATSVKEIDKIVDQIYAAGAESMELLDRALVKKESFEKTVTELKEAIVQRLKAGDTITGTVSKKVTDDPTIFEFKEEGKPAVIFYNKGGETITFEDMSKTATLKLVEKVVTPTNKEFYNVVEVYIDGKYVGNVAETDFKATNLSDTIIKATTPKDLINNFSLYAANPKLRKKFTYKTKDNIEQIYTFEEIIDLTKRTLSGMSLPTEEKNEYLDKIDTIVQSELGLSEKKISPEDKKSAQDAIDDAADRSASVTIADINYVLFNQSQKEIDDNFDNTLGCK